MSRIRSTNTKPELLVRRYLWRLGYRYRLYTRRLPGKPDIVLTRLHTVIQVNGCFWHGHDCRPRPDVDTNGTYWSEKIRRNRQRDIDNGVKLRAMGWTVITIWECELTPARRMATLLRLSEALRLTAIALGQPIPEAARAAALTKPTPVAYATAEQDVAQIAAEPHAQYGKTKQKKNKR